MYFLNKFCCICMNKSDLKHLFDVDSDGLSYYNKLTSSVAEMNFEEMNDQRLICGECLVALKTVYNFRRACLRSKTNLITYISQLQTSSHVSSTLSVRLRDYKHEKTLVKKEIEIGSENEDSNCFEENTPQSDFQYESCEERFHISASIKEEFMGKEDFSLRYESAYTDYKVEDVELRTTIENNPQNELHAETYEKDIHIFASVKEEYNSDEDLSFTHEDTTVDLVNGSAHTDFKVQELGHGTITEDEHLTEASEIDIKECSLEQVKDEQMSVPKPPQDGSTSQADARTSETRKCNIYQKDFIAKDKLTAHKKTQFGQEMETLLSRSRRTEASDSAKPCSQSVLMPINASPSSVEAATSYECEVCKKNFIHKCGLNRHMRIHSGERYECDKCDESFIQKCNLTDHLRMHSGEKPYECEVCKKCFVLKRAFNIHKLIHLSERPYKCEICNKRYIHRNKLTAHKKIHLEEYNCEICKKKFIRKSNLTRHIRMHSGDKSYECEICKMNFINPSHRTYHMRLHSGEKPYECEVCKKCFIQKSNLTNHLKSHSGERPYECEICKKTFILKGFYNKHLLVHSDKRPYKCETCQLGFMHEDKLARHMRSHFVNTFV